MTNAIISDIEAAAIPTAIAVLQALQTFNTAMGVDPLLWAVKYPGAFTSLVGALEQQVPTLAQAEGGAVVNAANQRIASWISSLQAKIKSLAQPAAPVDG